MTDPSPKPEPLALRPREAAEALGLSPRTLWSLTARGDLSCIKVGRSVRYSLEGLREWLRAKQPSIKEAPYDTR
ncbi:MAG: helix-turn-helix domain-containing protein [Phycisphaerae bacterium]|nr:helix-turn-helix domain-containing protein [Phycisphaerae bacterium]